MPRTAAFLIALALTPRGAFPQSSQDPNALLSQFQANWTEVEAIHAHYRVAEGEERAVLAIQLARRSEATIASFLGVADAILAAEAAGRDVSTARTAVADILEQATRMKRGDVGSARDRLSQFRDLRNGQATEERLPTERLQSEVDAELDRHLESLLRIAGFKERLALDTRDDLAYLDGLLEERAVSLGAQMEVSRVRAAESSRRLQQLGGERDAVLGVENRAATERLEGATRSLTATVRLFQSMAISLASRTVVLVGVLIGLTQVGVEIAPLLAGLGVAGFIVGFALQDSLSNFAAGIMILFYRPFDVGHVVEAGEVFGKVSDMSLVSTTLMTFDNQKLVVPNRKIWGTVIRNLSSEKTRRVDLVFAVDDAESSDRVIGLLREVVASDSRVLDSPEPAIHVDRLRETSYDVVVRPWVATNDYWNVYWSLTKAVQDRFESAGIARPHPKHNIRVQGAIA